MQNDIRKFFLQVEKPARYLGNEINSIHKDKKEYDANMCLIFPDIYEVGMSNLGFKILYNIINTEDRFYMERSFSPAGDMEKIMRENNFEAFSLETKTPIKNFDLLGFSLSYELSYTNVLNILELGNIPFRAKDRGEEFPILIAGGSCTTNPEPIKEFFDIIFIGDAEEILPKIIKNILACKKENKSKEEKLEAIKNLDGVFIPSKYSGEKISRAIIKNFDDTKFYENQLVPFMEIVHDRAAIEIQRGCTRGCRFCQAGMIYRPLRERSLEKNIDLAEKMLIETGHKEISLLSLSSSDYSKINELIKNLKNNPKNKNLSISLPSLRMNKDSVLTAVEISGGRRPSFTFAPEAGSQRMRAIINKGVSEEEIIETALTAVENGWQNFKFYFMIGLPFETDEDLIGIFEIVRKVSYLCRRTHSKKVSITVSVSNFVPKPHTPFQWHKQMGFEEMAHKHNLLRNLFSKQKGLTLKIHGMRKSYLEGIVSRGDYKIGDVIELAYKKGVKFDDYYDNFDIWMNAFKELNIDETKYLEQKNIGENLPWDYVDVGVSKDYLIHEYKKAEEISLTPECRIKCSACGVQDICEIKRI
ncbi:MAG: TIGR03960 family B12-binding radical SAM protein [Fusobacteriaceae bacterium]